MNLVCVIMLQGVERLIEQKTLILKVVPLLDTVLYTYINKSPFCL